MKNKNNPSPVALTDFVFSFQKSRILLTAYELGIFTILDNAKKTSSNVAKSARTDPRGTDRLMNALCAMGLLDKKGDRFFNADISLRFLVKGKKDYMSGLNLSLNQWNTWGTLTDAVRKGGTVALKNITERDIKWLAVFIEAMHCRASKQTKEIVKLVDLTNVHRILDIGGGSGVFSTAFVNYRDDINATIFDTPKVVSLAKKYISEEEVTARINFISGDYNRDNFGSGFDMIFLSSIVHINSPSQNRRLIRRAVKSLNPGGMVVILDFIMDEDRIHPIEGSIFAINMLVATNHGDTYTESEIRSWMIDAGLSSIRRKNTSFGTDLIIGKKTIK